MMIREEILNEVTRILHGPISGHNEVLEKNPLDFYSVGVLFPQLTQMDAPEDQDDNSVGTGAINEEEGDNEVADNVAHLTNGNIRNRRFTQEVNDVGNSGELELTTKFRPSAAGISVLTVKGAPLTVKVNFAIYERRTIERDAANGEGTRQVVVFQRRPEEFTLTLGNGNNNFHGLPFTEDGNIIFVRIHEQAKLAVTTRPYPQLSGEEELEIRTFTLMNNNTVASFPQQKNPQACLFQPGINIKSSDHLIAFDDRTDLNILSPEDLNLKLLYRNYCIYAQGHGISVNWKFEDKLVKEVFTQVLPQEKVNGVDLNPEIFKNSEVLYIKRLSGSSINNDYQWVQIQKELIEFTEIYLQWIEAQEEQINTSIQANVLKDRARLNLVQCRKLYSRMQRGIEILSEDSDARKAFEDANRAMFMQRVLADFSKHRRKAGRVQSNDAAFDDALPDYSAIPYDAGSGEIWANGRLNTNINNAIGSRKLARWRPFQLAFLLFQVEGITNPSSEDRDTVDLIWFPTGGGKTEAYLGLTAFTIFYRRLTALRIYKDPDKGAGVTVLMRYTLRLLNKQQFERATILICSCDLIRRNEPKSYGTIRISNGIWMGRSMTPNQENDQIADYGQYILSVNGGQQPNTFIISPPLLSCPCCGNRLIREIENNRVTGRWGYFRRLNNMGQPTGRYLMACTNTLCDFHVTRATFRQNGEKVLPVYEVDQTIYQERPSLLFSTVDKFVQLAWRSEAFNLFNIEFNNNEVERLYPSPELIIQDELHLISSALGTIYGVYEIVIDRLCREAGGTISKVVGATATVRNAEEQCKRLYGRSNFLQFPPPATDADDSFYAKKLTEDPNNRLYVGFMPSGITTSTALIRLAAVLQERIPALPFNNEILDNHYTLVMYFNALKELGKFRTFLTDDIAAYRKLLSNHFGTFFKPFNNNTLCELSSVMSADDITNGLDRLEKTTLPKGLDENNFLVKRLFEAGIRTITDFLTAQGPLWSTFKSQAFFEQAGLPYAGNAEDYITLRDAVKNLFGNQAEPVQIAPATNMISVGVDIPRLNTMIVNGQPKTAAEYIQASSRVGREGPGVVFTFLAPTKNRDRSHYEQFKAFHQAYYYHVEASSVTPFSRPALEKVLPTVLIALTRSLFLKGANGVFNANHDSYTDFIDLIIADVRAKAAVIYEGDALQTIHDTTDQIRSEIRGRFQNLSNLAANRRLANYVNFMNYDHNLGILVTRIDNPQAYYNAPSQFVDTLLQDHVPTMQTLRNVESSSKIRIKRN
ncbi:helicase-related protein [Telluribacter sp.]|jgi:hypothetical protein|uniref:helicase-related protein n=1 Tax=Telluribacter sp. TaxID=1978767 RepID=UPI002E13BC51|nr:helicase-related protein [Telluribacter sp.]